jgi:DNA adenine methylase
MRPILRWAGSKTKTVGELVAHLPLEYGSYYEPFAGSASLFFTLETGPAVLGDINPHVCNLYNALKANAKRVAQEVEKLPADDRAYYELRPLLGTHRNSFQQAALFLYLNRYCFNGLYRENLRGRFNVPRGSKTGNMPSKSEIAYAGRLLEDADIVCGDFEKTIDRVRFGDFVYLDPPYYGSAATAGGMYGTGSATGRDLLTRVITQLERLSDVGASWILSYPRRKALSDIINKSARTKHMRVLRTIAASVGRRGVQRELLITNIFDKRLR